MPTKPLKKLLDRDFARIAASEIINIASPLLQELISFATNAWSRCDSSAKGEENVDLAVMMLYLHLIEITDGIEVLVSRSCANPAIPLVRSSFEAYLSIAYILEDDYARRSLAWLVDYVHNRLSMYDVLDISTDKGRRLQAEIAKSKWTENLKLPESSKVKPAKANLENFLNRPEIRLIEQEYRNNRGRHGRPPWYKLFGGPANLEELATRLGQAAAYGILYRNWSQISHAKDISRFLTRNEKGERAIYSLRNPIFLHEVATFSTSFILEANRLMLKKFRPGEEADLARWYEDEVREQYLYLCKLKVEIN